MKVDGPTRDCPGSGVVVDADYERARCECDDCWPGRTYDSDTWCPVCEKAISVEPVEPEGREPRFRIVEHHR